MNQYTVSLTFDVIKGNTPQEAVENFIKNFESFKNHSIYDVQDNSTNEKFTVDLSEDEDNQVLPISSNENKIVSDDVINVAMQINKTLTPYQIAEVLTRYPSEQDNDSSATWDLVIEKCIYDVIKHN